MTFRKLAFALLISIFAFSCTTDELDQAAENPEDENAIPEWKQDDNQVPQLECTDECEAEGVMKCFGTTKFRTCKNKDADPCLEWDDPTDCENGLSCIDGECKSAECPPPGSVPPPGLVFPDMMQAPLEHD